MSVATLSLSWQAFEATWIEACKVEGSVMMVPSDYDFLVGPITFSGSHCEKNIVFQVYTFSPLIFL